MKWANEMSQWELAAKLDLDDDLSLVPGTQMVERDNTHTVVPT